jgi:adenine phosphoribosyltransferase
MAGLPYALIMEADDLSEVRTLLRRAFRWRGSGADEHEYADLTGWWRDAGILRLLGPALARLFPEAGPTVVLGPESRGSLVGPLVALSLGTGFVEVRKNRTPVGDSDPWIRRTTAPDHRDRHLELGFRRHLLRSSDHVLLVDDWVDTGSQAHAVRAMVDSAGATWAGFSCIVDGLDDPRLRRDLGLRSLLSLREL